MQSQTLLRVIFTNLLRQLVLNRTETDKPCLHIENFSFLLFGWFESYAAQFETFILILYTYFYILEYDILIFIYWNMKPTSYVHLACKLVIYTQQNKIRVDTIWFLLNWISNRCIEKSNKGFWKRLSGTC